jgi:hypothetical protein
MDVRACEFLTGLRRQGFAVTREGDRIRVAPWSVLTDEQRTTIRRYKADLLPLLSCLDCGGPLPPENQYRCSRCEQAAWIRAFGS